MKDSAKWFDAIGGWLVVYTGESKKESKQFGECTSSNLLFAALAKMNKKEEEVVPPSLKVLPEAIQFLVNVKDNDPKLMMYLTITDGCNFEAGFEDIATMRNDEIVVGGKKEFRQEFLDVLIAEIKKHYDKVH